MSITAPDMATVNAANAAALGTTFPTLHTFVTFLSHLISQTNNSGRGISGTGSGSGWGRGVCFVHGGAEDANMAESAEAVGSEVLLP